MKQRFFFIMLLLIIPFVVNGQNLQEIKKSGKIHAAFTESDLGSMNYQLAKEFARFLNVELIPVDIKWEENFSRNGTLPGNYQINPNLSYTPDALKKADIICGSLYIYDWGKKYFDYAGILDLSDLLVIPKNAKNLKSYNELKGLTIAFPENRSYEANIISINDRIGGGIKFKKTKTENEAEQLVKNGSADGFVTLAYNALEVVKGSKDFKIAFPVAPVKKAGWVVKNGNSELADEINNFFETIKGNGKLDKLFNAQYGIDYNNYYEILNSYDQSGLLIASQRGLDEILESGKLVIALRDRLMVYNESKKQFNHYIAEEFAKFLGVELEIKYTPYFSKYFENNDGEIIKDSTYIPDWFNYFDVACEIMVPLEWRLKKVNVIPFISYAQVVIGRKDIEITSLKDLKKFKGVTSKGSAQEDILIRNNINNYYYAQANQFLEHINMGVADYTIGSDAVYRISQFSNLEAKFVIGQVGKFGWAVKKNQPKLRQKILEFFEFAKKEGILDKYFKIQTGMTLRATENYLTVLQETYQPGVFPFVFYGTKEGLPQEDILSVFQDNNNYMWFGTHSGVARYNGREISVYNTAKGLSNNSVFDIAQDTSGAMYFATLNGVSKLENNKMATLFPDRSFRGIFVDDKNNKLFYGDNGVGISKADGSTSFLNDGNLELPVNVYAITKSDEKTVYMASKEGLFAVINELDVTRISGKPCYYALVDVDNQLWVSTQEGIYLIDLSNYENQGLGVNITDQLNIPKNTVIKKIQQRGDGTIWFMSDSKIFQLITLKQKPIMYDENIGLMEQRILSFLEDHENNLWIGYSGGIQKLTNKSLRLLYPEKIKSYVNSIVEDKKGRMWLSSNRKVFLLKEQLENFTENFNGGDASYVVSTLSNGNIVIASTVGLYEIDVKNLMIIKEIIFTEPLQYLQKIFISSKDEIFLLTGLNGVVYYLKDFTSEPRVLSNKSTSLIHQLAEFNGKLVGGNNTELVSFNGVNFETLLETGDIIWSVCPDGDILWIGTDKGLAFYEKDEYHEVDVELPNQLITAIKPDNNSTHLWLGTNEGFVYYNKVDNRIELSVDAKDGLQGNEISIDGLYTDKKGILWIGTYHGISTFDIRKNRPEKYTPQGIIEKIWLNGEEVDLSRLSNGLKYYENNIIFEITGLSFKDEKSVEYEFFMKGLENDYAASKGKQYKAQYTNLPPGKYEFNFRTKGNDGIWSYYEKIEFEIYKPIYAEWWFILLSVITTLLGFYGIVRWRNLTLRKRNAELERIVKIRTSEIQDKNEELQEQNEEIITQRDQIDAQHNAITDSIYYAKRIQSAVLPRNEYIEKILPESFILFRPRDIVSGDFYWIKQLGKYKVIVAADCTGHGVPGSIMSMLGVSFINEIVQKREIIQADTILNELRLQIKDALRQTSEVDEIYDGMDLALCVINTETNNLQYAGAGNPLYYVQNNEFLTIKGDRMPIGYYPKETEFTMHNIQMSKGDVFYIFSDGFVDQFGGRGDKFLAKNFRKILLEIHSMPMSIQKELLEKELDNWKVGFEQTDDILVMGVRI